MKKSNEYFTDESFRQKIRQIESIYVGYPRFEEMIERIKYIHEFSRDMAEPECLLIKGDTGAGKTTLYKQYLKKHKPTMVSNKTRIPVLLSLIPTPATVPSFLEKLLRDLGDVFPEKGTKSAKSIRLNKYLKDCGVELIILDEFQHFIDRDSRKVLLTVSDLLKVIIEETGIPVILFGMPESENILEVNPQLERRFADKLDVEPFRFNTKEQQKEFRTFLKALDQSLPFEKLANLADPETAYKTFYASDGTVGYVMKLIRKAAIISLINKEQCITIEALGQSFDRFLRHINTEKLNPFIDKNYPKIQITDSSLDSNNTTDGIGISNRLHARKERGLEVKDVL